MNTEPIETMSKSQLDITYNAWKSDSLSTYDVYVYI